MSYSLRRDRRRSKFRQSRACNFLIFSARYDRFKFFIIKLQCSTEGRERTFCSAKLSRGSEIRGPGIREIEGSRKPGFRCTSYSSFQYFMKSVQDGQTNKKLFLHFIGAASLLFVRSGVRDNIFLAHV